MRARSATRLATLTLLAGGLLVASCRDDRKNGPGPAIALDIDLRTPGGIPVAELCSNFGAILLTVHDAGIPRSFLLDPSGNLYGCGTQDGGPCEDSEETIQIAFTDLEKVSVELIDRTPATFLNTSFNVVCRGVADLLVGSDLTPISGAGTTGFHANVKLLRIGAMNALFDMSGGHPKGVYLAGSSIAPVPPNGFVPRTQTGGGIVFAGGYDLLKNANKEIHRFDPATVSLFRDAATLTNPRGGLTATAIADTNGGSRVLFAGGAQVGTSSTASLPSAELYDPVTRSLTTVTLNFARSGHSAVYLPEYTDGISSARPAVILLGGCTRGECVESALSYTTSTVEAFYLSRPEQPLGATCQDAPGGPGTCSFSLAGGGCDENCPDPARSLAAAGPLTSASFDLYYGQGYEAPVPNSGGTAGCSVMSNHTFGPFSVVGDTFFTFAPGVAILSSSLGIFGGYTSQIAPPLAAHTEAVLVTKSTSAKVFMLSKRGSPTSTALLDGRVVIAGGNTGTYYQSGLFTRSVEIYDPAVTGNFRYLTRLEGTCTAPGQPGCETMADVRAGHAAVRIDGSLSWLNGAVVIAGGQRQAADDVAPEIFVPAYTCENSGAIPQAILGRVDFCDRKRIPAPPTDPRAP